MSPFQIRLISGLLGLSDSVRLHIEKKKKIGKQAWKEEASRMAPISFAILDQIPPKSSTIYACFDTLAK